MVRLLVIVALVAGCTHEQRSDKYSGMFSFHAKPFTCVEESDCPETYWCDGVCKNEMGDALTINYVPNPSTQDGSQYQAFARYHSFQVNVSYLLDSVGLKSWGRETERSVRLALGTYYKCSEEDLGGYLVRVGLVEFCLDPFDIYPFGDRCIWDSGIEKQGPCDGLQADIDIPVRYQGEVRQLSVPKNIEDKKEFLADLLHEYGAFSASMQARYRIGELVQQEGYKITGVEVYDSHCDLSVPPSPHAVSVVGYDFTSTPVFFVQDSQTTERTLWRLDYYSWAEKCEFGAEVEVVIPETPTTQDL